MHEALASRRSSRLTAAFLAPGDKLRANFPERDVRGDGWTVGTAERIGDTHVVVELTNLCFAGRVERFVLSAFEEVDVWHRTCRDCGVGMLAASHHWPSDEPVCSYCEVGLVRPQRVAS